MVSAKFRLERIHTGIDFYVPEEGRAEEIIGFYEKLQKEVVSCSKTENVTVYGDLNVRKGPLSGAQAHYQELWIIIPNNT